MDKDYAVQGESWQDYIKPGDKALFIRCMGLPSVLPKIAAAGVDLDHMSIGWNGGDAEALCEGHHLNLLESYMGDHVKEVKKRDMGILVNNGYVAVNFTGVDYSNPEENLRFRFLSGNPIDLPKVQPSKKYDVIITSDFLNHPSYSTRIDQVMDSLMGLAEDDVLLGIQNELGGLIPPKEIVVLTMLGAEANGRGMQRVGDLHFPKENSLKEPSFDMYRISKGLSRLD